MKALTFVIALAATGLAGCQDSSPPEDATASSTAGATTTTEGTAGAPPGTTSTNQPPVTPQDPFASVVTFDACRTYHVAPTVANEQAQRIVPPPYVAESSFPLITDIIITTVTCEAIVIDNVSVAAPAAVAFVAVVATPPENYDDPDRTSMYDVVAYTDSELLAHLFSRIGHDVELASEVTITAGEGPSVYAIIDGTKPFEWNGLAYGGTKAADFQEPNRRFFMDGAGSAWMDLDLHREADSMIPLEPGVVTWDGGPLAEVFGLDTGQTEATGVEVVGTGKAVFTRAPDYGP